MSRRAFVPWPDKRLRTAAKPVVHVDEEVRAIWDEMIETMDAMPGYGLAAPQIGILRQLAVVDCSSERGQAVRLANPKIVEASDEMFGWDEASPNLPGLSAKIIRPKSVTVDFFDEAGQPATQVFSDLWSTSVQHQIDHLQGRMFFDNLSRTRRQMLLNKARKGVR